MTELQAIESRDQLRHDQQDDADQQPISKPWPVSAFKQAPAPERYPTTSTAAAQGQNTFG